jgi:hypothetical protein
MRFYNHRRHATEQVSRFWAEFAVVSVSVWARNGRPICSARAATRTRMSSWDYRPKRRHSDRDDRICPKSTGRIGQRSGRPVNEPLRLGLS